MSKEKTLCLQWRCASHPDLSLFCRRQSPKFSHISPPLKSLHWLKINKRVEYKLLSLAK